ncbi:MAG TPA: glutathione peroxidase [Ruminococcaceae bacterium]|nr:glutathione peroxidase [Oscillospiraceae bacterium]
MSIYDFSVKTMKGEEKSLADYKGKVLLIVNTATKCGFTPQYTGLQALYQKYAEQGLEILDFPCNQFAEQAPGDDESIHNFCTGRFGVTFPQFAKIKVNGDEADPFYVWLKGQKGGLFGENIKWNFTKFLVNREGKVIARFAPTKTPKALDKEIASLL